MSTSEQLPRMHHQADIELTHRPCSVRQRARRCLSLAVPRWISSISGRPFSRSKICRPVVPASPSMNTVCVITSRSRRYNFSQHESQEAVLIQPNLPADQHTPAIKGLRSLKKVRSCVESTRGEVELRVNSVVAEGHLDKLVRAA